jgi:dephospho-CoA kinase
MGQAAMGPAVRVGLTGGIGSGKSTVAAMLAELGATVIDADAISRASTAAGGSAMGAIRAHFGPEFVTANGALDRDRMRARVFSEPAARAELEAIIHPLVRAEMAARCAAMRGGCAVLDLPLLAESPLWQAQVDCVWVVDCTPETQVSRVMARNQWTREQVEAVLAAQATRAERLALADVVIHNDTATLNELRQEITKRYGELQQRFGL